MGLTFEEATRLLDDASWAAFYIRAECEVGQHTVNRFKRALCSLNRLAAWISTGEARDCLTYVQYDMIESAFLKVRGEFKGSLLKLCDHQMGI